MKNIKKTFIVAEISANHGGDLNKALRLIKEAKKAGADAVKFQTYTPDTLTLDVRNRYFMIKHPKWGGQTLYQLYQKAYTPWKWFKKLKATADDIGIAFFSTAFDKTSVDFLEGLGVFCHKIASFELVDIPLIEYAAKTRKPLILSTGMASLQEIWEAVSAARRGGAGAITLLKCVSSYPAKPEEMNLGTIPDLKKRFKVAVGLSDHTLAASVAVASVVLGATFVEKHFVISRKDRTPDSFFSIEPTELQELVLAIRATERCLGEIHYGPTKNELKSRVFRRSLFAVQDIKAGQRFTEQNVRSIRPSYGLPPRDFKKILTKKAARNLMRGEPLTSDAIAASVR